MPVQDARLDHAHHDDERANQLTFAVGLTAIVLVGEIVGGLLTNSLALLSDAGHLFSDVFSLALSLAAVRLACRPPTGRHSYGLHRTEVLAALFNGVTLVVVGLVIMREAYLRLTHPPEVKTLGMLIVALVGLVANWLVATRLKGHSHDDLNLRAAYLHVIGDLLASVGVVLAAIVIQFTGWQAADPIVSAAIALLILLGSVHIIRESVHILLEGTPRGLDLNAVAEAMLEVPGVEAVHHLHAWSICSHLPSFSAHVVACPSDEAQRTETRRKLQHILESHFGLSDTTLEFECEPCCEDQPLLQHREHGRREPEACDVDCPRRGHDHAHDRDHN